MVVIHNTNLYSVPVILLADIQLLRLVDLHRRSRIISSRSRRRPWRRTATERTRIITRTGSGPRQITRTTVTARTRTTIRRILLLIYTGSFPLHIEIATLENHFLFYHIGLWEIRTVFVEVGIGIRTTVVALELEIGVRRPGVRNSIVRIERESHLVFVMLFGHLLKCLRRWTMLSLGKLDIRIRGYSRRFVVVLIVEHGRGIVVLVV